MRFISLILWCFLASSGAANAVEIISTEEDRIVFLANGAPRTDFATAYVPDGGREADIYQRDIGYLGLSFGRYVSLTNSNLTQMLRDPDMVAVVPVNLIGNPAVSFVFDGSFFAFVATPGGLEPVEIRTPKGQTLPAQDLTPMVDAPRPIVEVGASRTTLIADQNLPETGQLDLALHNMRADAQILARLLERSNLSPGRSALAEAAELEKALGQSNAAAMFMAQSQNDPALDAVRKSGASFYAATNFGLVPVRLAAVPETSEPAAPKAQNTASKTTDHTPQPKVSEVEELAQGANVAETYQPPPAVPMVFDFAKTDALVYVVPAALDPATLRSMHLVWRMRWTHSDASNNRVVPYLSPADATRVDAFAAQMSAVLPDVEMRNAGIFSDPEVTEGGFDPRILENLAKSQTGLAVPLHLAVDPLFITAFRAQSVSLWQTIDGRLQRISGLKRWHSTQDIAFDTLDGDALVLVGPSGVSHRGALDFRLAAFAGQSAGAMVPLVTDIPNSGDLAALAEYYLSYLGGTPKVIDQTGQFILSQENGGLPVGSQTVFLFRAKDLRRPDLQFILSSAKLEMSLLTAANLTRLFQQSNSAASDESSAALAAHRAERRAIIEAANGVIALPRDGAEMETALFFGGTREFYGLRYVDGYWAISTPSRGIPMRNLRHELRRVLEEAEINRRLAVFWQDPKTAVLLPAGANLHQKRELIDAIKLDDLDDAKYDGLFDGTRQFVSIRGNQPVDIPALPTP